MYNAQHMQTTGYNVRGISSRDYNNKMKSLTLTFRQAHGKTVFNREIETLDITSMSRFITTVNFSKEIKWNRFIVNRLFSFNFNFNDIHISFCIRKPKCCSVIVLRFQNVNTNPK